MKNLNDVRLRKSSTSISSILVILVLVSACGRDENRPRKRSAATPTATVGTPPQSSPGHTPGAESDIPENRTGEKRRIGGVETVVRGQASTLPGSVDIEAGDNFYKPNILTGVAGSAIVATVKNSGQRLHNFSVTGQDTDQDIKVGEAPSVVFTFPDSGKIVFFCKFHREDGMVGELQVT